MRYLGYSLAGLLGLIALVLAAVLLLFPGNVVESEYASVQEARADRLFERGWLPDVLPLSASAITVSSDLDDSTSWGSFAFAPTDWDDLVIRLQGSPEHLPIERWRDEMLVKRQNGFTLLSYSADQTHWAFLCKQQEGRCDYVMWMAP